ncbi:putative GTP-binding protein 6 [Macrosteles quadrilineatus]|uniref:putative GTP-binding protein 6 n=1 Tax=Macrosteles quadrilineatus TaxID=74068 RepID=UPI0023E2449A|nr:putative GTP-binding protein 6 [Macrosteles quadrilineatus]
MFRFNKQIFRQVLFTNHTTKHKWNNLIEAKQIDNHKFSSVNIINCSKTTSYRVSNRIKHCQKFSITSRLCDSNFENEYHDEDYEELVKRTLKISDTGHQVLIIQPYVKWGKQKKRNTTPQLQLDEAIALIQSLPMWKVVSSKIISLMSIDKAKMFGKGNLNMLTDLVKENKTITAVFVSVNMLNPLQQELLEKEFGVPVFDRYTIVVQIFKLHATTREAKLQVSMGEIPYLWSRLRADKEGMSDKMGGGATVGGPGETYLEIKRRLLQDKERKLKNEIKKLKSQRDLLRSKRKDLNIPTIAVVGYTNAGKTSLIKALTKEDKLRPRNVLFATLDVTVHTGHLPSGLKVLFVDTVGFLSDIPTGLIQSFVATLEDAVQSDAIIHVVDANHPDSKAQSEHVLETLKGINLPDNLLENMITVANKIDLVSDFCIDVGNDALSVSATEGTGLDILKRKVEEKIIKATGQIFIKIRVSNGGEEHTWLQREATVVNVAADENNYQFVFLNTLITEPKLNIFKHRFISSRAKKGKS